MTSQMEQLYSELKRLIAIGRPLEEKSRKCIRILESLQYERMTARCERIVEAHAKTFEWIYEESTLSQHGELQHHFLRWLETGDGLFWVSGKAGSGKSTLMKFITEHPKTRQALSQWASDQHLITASFYFWHAGTGFQKSQEGLLQSLLYEIFSQCPELIPDVLPERWKLCKPSNPTNGHWSRAELIKTFAKLSNQPIMLKHACFFIDGLDEYDGDYTELIRLLRSFSRPNNMKICASSRPLNVFKRAFGTGSHTMLRLEDLTRHDITLYVRETLERNNLFNQLRRRENAHCVDLVNEVVSRAQGVFLWVFLVVRSLLTGLTNADRITDLRRRLRLLPSDLESYFAHMLASIDTFYEQQTAQTLQIALHALEPQTIMTYVMLDELYEDPRFALDLSIREWQSNEIRSRTESMELRINARGMGLLEVVRSKDSDGLGGDEVDFLHRTVRDFFRLEAPEDWIARRLPPRFNPDQLLYNATLAQVKIMSVDQGQGPGKLVGLVDNIMLYAHNLGTDLEIAPTVLFDNLSQPQEIIWELIKMFRRHGERLNGNFLYLMETVLQCPNFSAEQKAELKVMLPSDHIDHLDLPYRLNPPLGQSLDNPGESRNDQHQNPTPSRQARRIRDLSNGRSNCLRHHSSVRPQVQPIHRLKTVNSRLHRHPPLLRTIKSRRCARHDVITQSKGKTKQTPPTGSDKEDTIHRGDSDRRLGMF